MGEGAYEREREARVRRNRARMAQLVVQPGPGPGPGAGAGPGAPRRREKRARARGEAAAASAAAGPARRSRRLEGRPAGAFLTYFADDKEDEGPSGRDRAAEPREKRSRPPPGPRPPPPPPAPDSCRALDADVAALQADWVGEQIVPLDGGGGMKAAAMARLRGVAPYTRPPRFSKYSGIQEWRNAVALFVNVSEKTGDLYDNVFSVGATRMSWFAQKFHTEESPVIVKMLGGDGAPPAVPVVLFVRRVGEAYVYCGRLTPAEVFPDEQPIKVVWTLEDAGRFSGSQALQELLGPEVLQGGEPQGKGRKGGE